MFKRVEYYVQVTVGIELFSKVCCKVEHLKSFDKS